MSALANLKLVAAQKPSQLSVVVIRRNKVIERLHEQIELVKAHQEGRAFAATRRRSVKNAETGECVTVEMPKRVKAWWWTAENGKICLSVRYGARVIELAKGKTAIEVNNMAELISALETLKAVIKDGELDAQIEAVANRDKSVRRK